MLIIRFYWKLVVASKILWVDHEYRFTEHSNYVAKGCMHATANLPRMIKTSRNANLEDNNRDSSKQVICWCKRMELVDYLVNAEMLGLVYYSLFASYCSVLIKLWATLSQNDSNTTLEQKHPFSWLIYQR